MAFLIETSVTHSVIATDRSSSSVVYYAVSQLRIPLACLNAYHLYRANLERGLKARCITGGKKSEEGARGGRAQKQAWMARYRSGSAASPLSCCRCRCRRQSFNLGNHDEDGLPLCPLARGLVLLMLEQYSLEDESGRYLDDSGSQCDPLKICAQDRTQFRIMFS